MLKEVFSTSQCIFKLLVITSYKSIIILLKCRLGPQFAFDSLGQALSKVLNVMFVQTSHGDTAVLGHVHVSVLGKVVDLFFGDTGEREHA